MGEINWLDREVSHGKTTFRIGKLLAMEAWAVKEILRPALLDGVDDKFSANVFGVTSLVNSMGMPVDNVRIWLSTAIARLPSLTVERIRVALFRHVYFTTTDTHPTQTPLYKNEAAAFDGLEFYHVDEVLLRAACVNFTESFSAMTSLLTSLASQYEQSETPT